MPACMCATRAHAHACQKHMHTRCRPRRPPLKLSKRCSPHHTGDARRRPPPRALPVPAVHRVSPHTCHAHIHTQIDTHACHTHLDGVQAQLRVSQPRRPLGRLGPCHAQHAQSLAQRRQLVCAQRGLETAAARTRVGARVCRDGAWHTQPRRGGKRGTMRLEARARRVACTCARPSHARVRVKHPHTHSHTRTRSQGDVRTRGAHPCA
jgi:hypothetical protein